MKKPRIRSIAGFGFRRSEEAPDQGMIVVRTLDGEICLTQSKERLIAFGEKIVEFARSLETKN